MGNALSALFSPGLVGFALNQHSGDDICDEEHEESPFNCSADCYCGNGLCESSENIFFCPDDCVVCGDGICDEPLETLETCAFDCFTLPEFP